MSIEARQWIRNGEYEIPKRMPHVGLMYSAGAKQVVVDEFDEISGRMTLHITFPDDGFDKAELWLHIVGCEHDGVSLVSRNPLVIKMVIEGTE